MLAGERQRARDIAAKGDFNRIRTALAHKRVRPSAAKQGYVGAARSNRQYNGRDGSGHRPGQFVLAGTLPIFAPPVDWRARSTPLAPRDGWAGACATRRGTVRSPAKLRQNGRGRLQTR